MAAEATLIIIIIIVIIVTIIIIILVLKVGSGCLSAGHSPTVSVPRLSPSLPDMVRHCRPRRWQQCWRSLPARWRRRKENLCLAVVRQCLWLIIPPSFSIFIHGPRLHINVSSFPSECPLEVGRATSFSSSSHISHRRGPAGAFEFNPADLIDSFFFAIMQEESGGKEEKTR